MLLIGGGSVGCEIAKLLVQKGKQVTLVELSNHLCSNLNEHVRMGLLQCLKDAGDMQILLQAECKEIQKDRVMVSQHNQTQSISADTVIVAVGMQSRKDIANAIYGIVQDTSIIGDANRPATVAEATHDGYYVSATL